MIDEATRNEDWIKTGTWDMFLGAKIVTTVPMLLACLRLGQASPIEQRSAVAHAMSLPSWEPAPASLKAEAEAFVRGEATKGYNPDQPRAADGRWGSGGESSTSSNPTGKISSPIGADGITVDPTFLATNRAATDLINEGSDARLSYTWQAGEQKAAIAEDLARRLGDKFDEQLILTNTVDGRTELGLQHLPDTPENRAIARAEGVSFLVSQWAQTSNDNNATALAMQEAAVREFGLTDAAEWEQGDDLKQQVADELQEKGDLYQAFLRAQYESTQEYLAKGGIVQMGLYRGVEQDPSVMSGTTLRPMSSYAYERGVASEFGDGGSLILTTVPADRVLSCARTGFGCLAETEVVVLGGHERLDFVDPNATIVSGPQGDALVMAGGSYRGMDFTGADMHLASMRESDFSSANLSGADLSSAYLPLSNFERADLSGANLESASIGNSNLTESNLTGARLVGAYVNDANLTGATLREANLGNAAMRRANLTDADLTNARLRNATLLNATVDGANFSGADLTRANVDGVDFTNAIADEHTIAPPGWTIVNGEFQRTST